MSESAKKLPSHELFSVCKTTDGKSSWTKIGAAWPHKNGKGFSFKLSASVAPGGEFVMRVFEPRFGARSA